MKYQILLTLIISTFLIGIPTAYFTQSGGGIAEAQPLTSGANNQPLTSGANNQAVGGLGNPLASNTIEGFLLQIIDILLIFALPIIVFFIMYAGFLYVTARGDVEQIKKARTALTWSVVGGVIVLGAKVLIEVIKGTINAL